MTLPLLDVRIRIQAKYLLSYQELNSRFTTQVPLSLIDPNILQKFLYII